MNEQFERLERLRAENQNRRALPLEQALGGHEFQGDGGVFHLRCQTLDGRLCHGPFSLDSSLQAAAAMVGRAPLFLDTETTGLAGGTGTYAFMVGIAFFESGHLHIEQLIMRSHCEEKAMLKYLVSRLQAADCLVTFNGKTFDAPLLQTRLIMNRLRFDLEEMPHLDLLPPARRLWSLGLENCKLETLETEILGLPRQGDVPGWMVPQLFFRYLQDGCARGLAQVAEHNRRDILAMVGLLGGLAGYFDDPLQTHRRFRQDPTMVHLEDLALGLHFFRQRRFDVSGSLLQRAWDFLSSGTATPALRRAGSLLARLRRRQGQREQAQELWQALADRFPLDPEILEQIAKQQEHLARNWPQALHWVDRALSLDRLSRGRRKRLLLRRRRLELKIAQ